MRLSTPFTSAGVLRRNAADDASTFATRRFAMQRADFILREYAKQQDDAPLEGFSMGSTEPEEMAVLEAAEPVTVEPVAEEPGIPVDESERLIREAEQRGREQALAEMSEAIGQAVAALDAAAQALAVKVAELERQLIVPLAQASVQIAAQIARQTLSTPEGLERYLETVLKALSDTERQSERRDIVVRLNAEDLEVLERGSNRPQHLRLQADPAVSRGGVIVGGEGSVIDDRLENRIREVREAALAAAAELLRESRE